MTEAIDISTEDRELMVRYNIRSESRTVFYYEGYKYEKLKDAIRYAELVEERATAADSD